MRNADEYVCCFFEFRLSPTGQDLDGSVLSNRPNDRSNRLSVSFEALPQVHEFQSYDKDDNGNAFTPVHSTEFPDVDYQSLFQDFMERQTLRIALESLKQPAPASKGAKSPGKGAKTVRDRSKTTPRKTKKDGSPDDGIITSQDEMPMDQSQDILDTSQDQPCVSTNFNFLYEHSFVLHWRIA